MAMEKVSLRKAEELCHLIIRTKGSMIIWHPLSVVPMVRNVHEGNSRDLPDSSFMVPVNCGHDVTLVLGYAPH